MKRFFIGLFFCLISQMAFTQTSLLGVYVSETGNRGFAEGALVEVFELDSQNLISKGNTNADGFAQLEIPQNSKLKIQVKKRLFENFEMVYDATAEKKQFVRVQIGRAPGYNFEVTLAPKRSSEDEVVDGIKGAWIEVYNNTTDQEILNLKDHPDKDFSIHFEQGNHYTIMIRKGGYFNKRLEAYVNVEGCILCFDGVGSVRPGVTDNLTEGNKFGVLLANIELDPLFEGKTFKVENIYYDYALATLRPKAKKSLDNLSIILADNPHVKVELGSHTDSRGKEAKNQALSDARAASAVKYLVDNCDIDRSNIIAHGYGESQIVNRCKNGVDCSEEEHQLNRRTEIKILGIDAAKTLEKPLVQIRREEIFKEKLFSEEGIETIQVEDSVKMQPSNATPSKDVGKESNNDQTSSNQQLLTKNIKTVNNFGDFTGYKILLYQAKKATYKQSNVLFDFVWEFIPGTNSYFYLTGAFKTKEQAETFLNNQVLEAYPDATIIQFKNGKRI